LSSVANCTVRPLWSRSAIEPHEPPEQIEALVLVAGHEDEEEACEQYGANRFGSFPKMVGVVQIFKACAPAPAAWRCWRRCEISKNAPPIDFKAPLDSLEIMEGVMRHFHQRALIEQRMDPQADWSVVDALMLKTLAAAEKVARYRHAQLSAVRLAGDISGKMDDLSLDELLVTIKQEWAKLAPLIDLEAVQVPPG
jgi:hypothetical protein